MVIEELPDPRVLFAETDWSSLETSFEERGEDDPFGPVLSTKAALAAITSGDRHAVTRAVDHLGDVLLHQGTLYGATGPAALYVAALLADPGSRYALVPAWEAGRRPLRAKLVDWVAAVARAVSDAQEQQWTELLGGSWALLPRVQEVRALRPALCHGVSACFADPDPAVREAAHAAAIPLLDAPALRHYRAELIPVLRRELAVSSRQGYRLEAIIGLRAWGEDTADFAAHAELIEYEQREKEWEERRSAQGSLRGPQVDDDPPF